MAGRGTISVNQSPQHGDKTALDSASKAITYTPDTMVPTPAKGAGRPRTSGPQQAQQPSAQPQAQPEGVPTQHQDAIRRLRDAYRVNQYWQNVYATYPDEWTRWYAQDAQRNLEQVKMMVRNSTPFFSE